MDIFSKNKPLVMGIINTSKTSFSGDALDVNAAFEKAKQMIKQGADIIDIGGVSTNLQEDNTSENKELELTIPLIERLAKETNSIISIDTKRSRVMDEAMKSGCHIINDTSALSHDKNSINVVLKHNAYVVLMHSKKHKDYNYNNVVLDVFNYLTERSNFAIASGVDRKKIIIDVGLGFAKNADLNLALQQSMHIFTNMGFPVLIGASRKPTISILGEDQEAGLNRIGGGIASVLFAYTKGVKIFRVHDVHEIKQALTVFQKLNSSN